jgi:hypothetical protein
MYGNQQPDERRWFWVRAQSSHFLFSGWWLAMELFVGLYTNNFLHGRAVVECRIDELKNELAADHFCLRSLFATLVGFPGRAL